MEHNGIRHITVLPKEQGGAFEDSGLFHTPYEAESAFFSTIRRGDVESLRGLLAQDVVVGRLSESGLRQAQYLAVCCITLGVRSAIEGGLPQQTAFHMSDNGIQRVDACTDPRQVEAVLTELLAELAALVRDNAQRGCPAPVRKCLEYIGRHLHEPIRLADLARATSFSGDYISRLFKKHMGVTLRTYILQKRLEAACELLRTGQDSQTVAYTLGFCSQTYFITCFKNAYGVTPHRYGQGMPEA